MILNERVLRVVLTLAEELHFGRAAARLQVSQPALSGTLKSLEQDLGVCLFRRTSRQVELTEAGRVFAAEARRLIQEGQRALAAVRQSAPDVLGPLRIGYPPSMNVRWLCSLISHAKKDPALSGKLQFVSTDPGTLAEGVTNRSLHAAFLTGELSDPDIHTISLFRDPFFAVVGETHRLSGLSSVDLKELGEEPVVWLGRQVDPPAYDGFLSLCSLHSYRPKIVQEVSTFQECLEFAREDLAITFLPSFVQTADRSQPVFLPLTRNSFHCEYRLAFRGGAPEVDRFVSFAQHYASQQMLPIQQLAS